MFRNNANKLSDRNLDKRLSPMSSIDHCSSQKLDSFQRDILSKGLYPRENVPQIKVCKTWAERSSNLVHYFQQLTLGNRCRLKLQKVGPKLKFYLFPLTPSNPEKKHLPKKIYPSVLRCSRGAKIFIPAFSLEK